MLHADLPLLGADDISAVIADYQASPGLLIGCDRHRRGTNLLAFGRDSRPRFCFGSDSYAAHCAAARDAGIDCREIYRPGIALDLDEAVDVAELMRSLAAAGARTQALLMATDLGRRLSVAVSALESGQDNLAEESRVHD